MTYFHANSVVVDDSDESFILVGFADEREGVYGEAIHFQRAHEFDQQDIELGMADVYIERGVQIGCGYGGIDSVSLHRDRVSIRLSGDTATSLGDTQFEISFEIPDAEFRRIREGLRRVFDGQQVLTECVAPAES